METPPKHNTLSPFQSRELCCRALCAWEKASCSWDCCQEGKAAAPCSPLPAAVPAAFPSCALAVAGNQPLLCGKGAAPGLGLGSTIAGATRAVFLSRQGHRDAWVPRGAQPAQRGSCKNVTEGTSPSSSSQNRCLAWQPEAPCLTLQTPGSEGE